MKILITRAGTQIINFATYNCQELGLAKALARRGHRVFITTPDQKEEHIQIAVEGGLPIEIYKLKLIKINKIVCWHRHLSGVLKEIDPDIIHLNGFNSIVNFYYAFWKYKHNCKAIMVEGTYQPTNKPILRQLQILSASSMGRYVLNRMDGYGCKTLWAGEYVRRFKKVEVFHTPIGLDDDRFLGYKEIDWRKKLGLETKKVLLYVGVQESRRNPLFLLNIVKILPVEYVLLMVGDGPLVADVNNLIKEMGLQERVLQLGKLPQNELPSLYSTSDIFLLASSYEIYGMVLLEAMYFGLPVISTLTAGSDCLIDDEKNGIIIKELNVEEWAICIRRLCEDSSKLQKLKEAAKEKIRNTLVWDKAVANFLDLYKMAVS